jgi:3-dehydroquinate synthase
MTDALVDVLARRINHEKGDAGVVVVTSRRVARIYGRGFLDPLCRAIGAGKPLALPDGEDRKTWDSATRIFDKLLANRIDRRGWIVAVGGGVVTDMAGFAASVFKRGLQWAAVPTTLTGQVDAALGGKTAVDFGKGKNMVGTFWQPAFVCLAPAFLATLPDRELRCGLSEVVKTGVALSPRLLKRLEDCGEDILAKDHEKLCRIVAECAKLKLVIVAADPLDRGVRAVLNLGHTAGHAIEAAGGFQKWNHGEAVAMGLLVIASLAVECGKMKPEEKRRVYEIVERLGLAPRIRPGPEDAAPFLHLDKKSIGRRIQVIVPGPLGRTTVKTIEPGELLKEQYWSWS